MRKKRGRRENLGKKKDHELRSKDKDMEVVPRREEGRRQRGVSN